MAAAETRAVVVGLVVVGVAAAAATYWHATHPDGADIAKLTETVEKAVAPKPAPQDAPKPAESAKTATPSAPKTADLGPAPTAPLPPPAAASEPPHFDVVRVEPTGEAVVAGKADPNARVALLASGKVLAAATTDAGGQFVIIPPTLAPGNYDLTLRQSLGGGKYKDSTQTVAVGVPAKRGDQVVVALAEPGKPTRLMSSPPQAPAPGVAHAPEAPKPPEPSAAAPTPGKPEVAVAPPAEVKPTQSLAIRSAELENGNGFYASGVAAPGTRLQLYLNGAHLAEVTAGPDGQWSVRIKKGLTGGHYAVRADAVDGDKVTARAEVPFDVPVTMAEAPKDEAAPKDAPPKVAEAAPEPPVAPTPSEAAGTPEAVPPAISPPQAATPPAAIQEVPTPRPDLAAAAKAAAGKAPDAAPPTLAAAPPAPPAAHPVPAPADMSISPRKPASAPPAIAAAPPSVAPPTQAVAPPGPAAPAAAPAASAEAKPAAGTPSVATPGANAVVEQVETALVIRGDNLWNISRAKLGRGTRYTQIYAANATQIRDPRLIYPGQVFVMPQQ